MKLLNRERGVRDIVVVAASAGGVEASLALVSALPGNAPVTIFLVIHRSPVLESQLAAVLQRRTTFRVVEPGSGDMVRRRTVYLAPRDQHMVIEDGAIALDRGPKQHHTRPAADPLFRSAATAYGSRVVAVATDGNRN